MSVADLQGVPFALSIADDLDASIMPATRLTWLHRLGRFRSSALRRGKVVTSPEAKLFDQVSRIAAHLGQEMMRDRSGSEMV